MKSIKQYIIEALKINSKSKVVKTNYLQKILELVKTHKLESINTYNNKLLIHGGIYIDDKVVDYIVFDNNKITCFYINSKTDEEGDFDCDESDWYDYFDEEVTKSVFKYLEKRLKEDK